MDFNDIKSWDTRMADGVWVGGLDNLGDVRLRVRPFSHPAVVKASGRAYRAASKGEVLSEEQTDAVERDIMAQAGLTGWENITAKGKPVKFTPEAAAELLKSEVFGIAVRTAMSRASVQVDAAVEALEKN